MNASINITIGLTDELKNFLSALVERLNPTPTVGYTVGGETLQEEALAAHAAMEQEEAPVEAEAPKAKSATEEDVRAAIARARCRIIGDDWEDNKTSDKYKTYYKPLNAKFKEIAVFCGADKPSALKDEEGRNTFIAAADGLLVNATGEIVSEQPF